MFQIGIFPFSQTNLSSYILPVEMRKKVTKVFLFMIAMSGRKHVQCYFSGCVRGMVCRSDYFTVILTPSNHAIIGLKTAKDIRGHPKLSTFSLTNKTILQGRGVNDKCLQLLQLNV